MVTKIPGLAIGVTAADCGPILFADPAARVIGAAHAGWKGAFSGVLENTIAAMENLGASRAAILAAIGPLIRQPSYEVGAEFVARFAEADKDNARFFVPSVRTDHSMFDLAGYIRLRLERAGILDHRRHRHRHLCGPAHVQLSPLGSSQGRITAATSTPSCWKANEGRLGSSWATACPEILDYLAVANGGRFSRLHIKRRYDHR